MDQTPAVSNVPMGSDPGVLPEIGRGWLDHFSLPSKSEDGWKIYSLCLR